MTVLLDIEGTIAPISFVFQVLFPFSKERAQEFLERNWEDPQVQIQVRGLSEVSPASAAEAAALVRELIDQDRKLGPLKWLQGRIWEEGYRNGQLQGQLFEEVADRVKSWKATGHRVYIYSSGSVLAQQLLLGHTQVGDLRPWIDGYFDTAVGAKGEAESYRTIATSTGVGLFATDIVSEAQAARAAGWKAVILDRPGNHPQPPHDFPIWKQLPEEVPDLG